MNVPATISETPKGKIFRLKGARYCFLYAGFIPKEAYYTWYKNYVITRRMEYELFIGHITLNNAQFTRVLFRSISQTVDWKSKEKLFFKVGDTIYQPEIRPVYKTSWAAELSNLYQMDPATYPPLNNSPGQTPVIQARSPKRIKGVSAQVYERNSPAPGIGTQGPKVLNASGVGDQVVPTLGHSVPILNTSGINTQGVYEPHSMASAASISLPESTQIPTETVSSEDSCVPKIDSSDESLIQKIVTVINTMGILEKLNTIEEKIGSVLNPPVTVISSDEVKHASVGANGPCSAGANGPCSAGTFCPIPELPPKIISKIIEPEIYGIYIEGDAGDIVGSDLASPSTSMNIVLENKSVINIKPVTSDKTPIFKTKLNTEQIFDILNRYSIWYVKMESGSYILKNTDMMILQSLV